MKKQTRNLLALVFFLMIMITVWINKIDSPLLRIFGIVIVSLTSYWVGRVHGKLVETGADGKDSLGGPSFSQEGFLGDYDEKK